MVIQHPHLYVAKQSLFIKAVFFPQKVYTTVRIHYTEPKLIFLGSFWIIKVKQNTFNLLKIPSNIYYLKFFLYVQIKQFPYLKFCIHYSCNKHLRNTSMFQEEGQTPPLQTYVIQSCPQGVYSQSHKKHKTVPHLTWFSAFCFSMFLLKCKMNAYFRCDLTSVEYGRSISLNVFHIYMCFKIVFCFCFCF